MSFKYKQGLELRSYIQL